MSDKIWVTGIQIGEGRMRYAAYADREEAARTVSALETKPIPYLPTEKVESGLRKISGAAQIAIGAGKPAQEAALKLVVRLIDALLEDK